MKEETICMVSIQVVSFYWHIQTVLMGTMHAKLMRTAVVWVQFQRDAVIRYGHHFIVGNGFLAVFIVNNLAWTIDVISREWQTYRAFHTYNHIHRQHLRAFNNGNVRLTSTSIGKLSLQSNVCFAA